MPKKVEMAKKLRRSNSWTEGPAVNIAEDIFETSTEAEASVMDISAAGSTPAAVRDPAVSSRIAEANKKTESWTMCDARKKRLEQEAEEERQEQNYQKCVVAVIGVFGFLSALLILYIRSLW